MNSKRFHELTDNHPFDDTILAVEWGGRTQTYVLFALCSGLSIHPSFDIPSLAAQSATAAFHYAGKVLSERSENLSTDGSDAEATEYVSH